MEIHLRGENGSEGSSREVSQGRQELTNLSARSGTARNLVDKSVRYSAL